MLNSILKLEISKTDAQHKKTMSTHRIIFQKILNEQIENQLQHQTLLQRQLHITEDSNGKGEKSIVYWGPTTWQEIPPNMKSNPRPII